MPFYGIFFLWKNFFQKKKLIYVNYLPLWNTLTILFLPPNTIMGPITGSVNINDKKNLSGLVRTYIFPILYRVNLRLMLIRNKKILFSTSILKKYISRENLNKCYFNFLNYLFKYEKFNKNKKNIDFLIYYRKHSNKYSNFHINFINKIVHKNKVVLFGDKLNIKGVINLNKISRKKVLSLLKRTKNSISGDDNLYSLYNIDCLKNGVIIFFNKRMKVFLDVYNKKNYLPINFDDNNLNLFKKKINQRKLFTKTKNKFFSDLDKKINKYFLTIS